MVTVAALEAARHTVLAGRVPKRNTRGSPRFGRILSNTLSGNQLCRAAKVVLALLRQAKWIDSSNSRRSPPECGRFLVVQP